MVNLPGTEFNWSRERLYHCIVVCAKPDIVGYNKNKLFPIAIFQNPSVHFNISTQNQKVNLCRHHQKWGNSGIMSQHDGQLRRNQDNLAVYDPQQKINCNAIKTSSAGQQSDFHLTTALHIGQNTFL